MIGLKLVVTSLHTQFVMGHAAALVAPTMPSRPPACAVNGTTAFAFATSLATIPSEN